MITSYGLAPLMGLDLMDIKTGTFRHFQNYPKDTDSISDNQIFTVTIDKTNRYG